MRQAPWRSAILCTGRSGFPIVAHAIAAICTGQTWGWQTTRGVGIDVGIEHHAYMRHAGARTRRGSDGAVHANVPIILVRQNLVLPIAFNGARGCRGGSTSAVSNLESMQRFNLERRRRIGLVVKKAEHAVGTPRRLIDRHFHGFTATWINVPSPRARTSFATDHVPRAIRRKAISIHVHLGIVVGRRAIAAPTIIRGRIANMQPPTGRIANVGKNIHSSITGHFDSVRRRSTRHDIRDCATSIGVAIDAERATVRECTNGFSGELFAVQFVGIDAASRTQ